MVKMANNNNNKKIDVMRYRQINRFLLLVIILLLITAFVIFSYGAMKKEDAVKCENLIREYFNYFPQDVLELNKEITCRINVLDNTCTCRINYIFDLE